MGYDRGDKFPFDYKPNGIPFGSSSKGKLSPPSYPIQCERQWKYSFLSVLFVIFYPVSTTFPLYIYIYIYTCIVFSVQAVYAVKLYAVEARKVSRYKFYNFLFLSFRMPSK